jgi:4,5-dihydroxyphthalate decarboxylase
MERLPITIACSDTDRTRPIIDGRIAVEGCRVTFIPLEPAETFFRSLRYREFDVAELSFSSYLRTVDAGDSPYIGIPAFISRLFRHSSFYIRTDRGIQSPADLRGRVVGVPEYQMTAPVWMRALLHEEYGVAPSEIHWRTGGQEQAGRDERTPLGAIPGVDIQPIGPDKTLSAMLASGEIDAMLAARTPSCFLRGAANVGRLFPDYQQVEAEYFRKTRLFPIMHLVGIRRELVAANPWLPASVYKALCEAKDMAVKRMRDVRVLPVTMPWIEPYVAAASALMGDDYWPYGVAENAHAIEAMTRYAHAQGLTSRQLKPDELFAASTLEISKV